MSTTGSFPTLSFRQIAFKMCGTVLVRVDLRQDQHACLVSKIGATYNFAIKRPELCRDNLYKILEHILRLFGLVLKSQCAIPWVNS